MVLYSTLLQWIILYIWYLYSITLYHFHGIVLYILLFSVVVYIIHVYMYIHIHMHIAILNSSNWEAGSRNP